MFHVPDQTGDDPGTPVVDTLAIPELYSVPALDGDPSLAPALELAVAALRRFRNELEAEEPEEIDRRIEELESFLAAVRDDDVRIVMVPAGVVYRE